MRLIAWRGYVHIIAEAGADRNHAGRIGAAAFIATRIGCVEKRLVGEIELRHPCDIGAARKLPPFLIDDIRDRIAFICNQRPARNDIEMLPVVRVA